MDKISRDWIPLNKDLCGTRVLGLNVLWRQAGNCRAIVNAIGKTVRSTTKIISNIACSYSSLMGDSVYLISINNQGQMLIVFIAMANVKSRKTTFFVLCLQHERPRCITFTNLSCRKGVILPQTVPKKLFHRRKSKLKKAIKIKPWQVLRLV